MDRVLSPFFHATHGTAPIPGRDQAGPMGGWRVRVLGFPFWVDSEGNTAGPLINFLIAPDRDRVISDLDGASIRGIHTGGRLRVLTITNRSDMDQACYVSSITNSHSNTCRTMGHDSRHDAGSGRAPDATFRRPTNTFRIDQLGSAIGISRSVGADSHARGRCRGEVGDFTKP